MYRYISYVAAIMKGHLTGRRIPIFVTLCVTRRCNLRCIYCYMECSAKNGREFTKEELFRLIDELARMGMRYISLNGGEVLLRDDIEEIIDKIKDKKILCHLSTNGLLAKKRLSALKKVDSIAISIDGKDASNDLNRGSGTFDKIAEALELLNRNGVQYHTHTVLTRNNRTAVEEMMDLAKRYGFMAQFSTLRPEDSPDKSIALSDDEARAIIRKIIGYKKSGFPVFFSNDAYKNALNWPFAYDKQATFEKLPEGYKPMPCFMKRFSCHIEPDGTVYPCIVLVNKFNAKNLREVGFKKAWEDLAKNECRACYNICCNDLNLTFGLRPHSLWNAFKIVIDRERKRVW